MAINPFNTVEVDTPNRNSFDLSHDKKLSLKMGNLTPVLCQEVVPGDIFKIRPEMFTRFAPLVFPTMHEINATLHFFYVPNRILWKNWHKFIAGENYQPLQIQKSPSQELKSVKGTLLDYLGLPITDKLDPINAFPILAYFRIFNEYYQDQNNDPTYNDLRNDLETIRDTTNGNINFNATVFSKMYGSNAAPFPLKQRAYEHDYFTSALPFAQKGTPVNIPIEISQVLSQVEVFSSADFSTNNPNSGDIQANATGSITTGGAISRLKGLGASYNNDISLTGTINQLRQAYALQGFLEKNARSGTRYQELMLAHYGEDIKDYRISKPEYIGGLKNRIQINEVTSTAQTTEAILGDYAGHASGYITGDDISYQCSEHGVIIGIMSVLPKTAYQQGLEKLWSKPTYLDYYFPEFAHLGEQAIKNSEVFYDSVDGLNNDTFGYIPRYSELKYSNSQVCGDFRDQLKDYHLGRIFANRPVLNSQFIYCNPVDQNRIFAVTSDIDNLYCHIYFNIQAQRKIPFFTNPSII